MQKLSKIPQIFVYFAGTKLLFSLLIPLVSLVSGSLL